MFVGAVQEIEGHKRGETLPSTLEKSPQEIVQEIIAHFSEPEYLELLNKMAEFDRNLDEHDIEIVLVMFTVSASKKDQHNFFQLGLKLTEYYRKPINGQNVEDLLAAEGIVTFSDLQTRILKHVRAELLQTLVAVPTQLSSLLTSPGETLARVIGNKPELTPTNRRTEVLSAPVMKTSMELGDNRKSLASLQETLIYRLNFPLPQHKGKPVERITYVLKEGNQVIDEALVNQPQNPSIRPLAAGKAILEATVVYEDPSLPEYVCLLEVTIDNTAFSGGLTKEHYKMARFQDLVAKFIASEGFAPFYSATFSKDNPLTIESDADLVQTLEALLHHVPVSYHERLEAIINFIYENTEAIVSSLGLSSWGDFEKYLSRVLHVSPVTTLNNDHYNLQYISQPLEGEVFIPWVTVSYKTLQVNNPEKHHVQVCLRERTVFQVTSTDEFVTPDLKVELVAELDGKTEIIALERTEPQSAIWAVNADKLRSLSSSAKLSLNVSRVEQETSPASAPAPAPEPAPAETIAEVTSAKTPKDEDAFYFRTYESSSYGVMWGPPESQVEKSFELWSMPPQKAEVETVANGILLQVRIDNMLSTKEYVVVVKNRDGETAHMSPTQPTAMSLTQKKVPTWLLSVAQINQFSNQRDLRILIVEKRAREKMSLAEYLRKMGVQKIHIMRASADNLQVFAETITDSDNYFNKFGKFNGMKLRAVEVDPENRGMLRSVNLKASHNGWHLKDADKHLKADKPWRIELHMDGKIDVLGTVSAYSPEAIYQGDPSSSSDTLKVGE